MTKGICAVALSPIVDFIAGALTLNMATKRSMIAMELMMKSTIRTTSRLFPQ